jgi:subtilisin family serine protease
LAIAIGIAACSDTPSGPGAAPTSAPIAAKDGAREPIPNRYVVVFKRRVRDAPGLARQLATAHGGTVHYTYQHAIKGFAATFPAAGLTALRNNPNVAYVEQDQRVHLVQTPQPNATWGLDRVDQRDLPLSGSYSYNGTGAGVNAYIIDTGIETSHPHFGGRASVGYDALGGNGQDCHGHGTHVAGTVGAATYGVAKSVALVSVRVFGCTGQSQWSTIIAAIDWVRNHHIAPAVANLSLGGGASLAVDDALRNLIASGVTVAVAAGNSYGSDACDFSPARVGEGLTVGATNSSDAVASFSNVGSCVDLFAPGEGVTSTWLFSTTNTISGTSMATPHVAGAAAVYLEANPSASPATVGSAIVANASPFRLSGVSAVSPNLLLYTLTGSTSPPLTVDISGPDVIYSEGTYPWQANAAGGAGAYSYQWQYRPEGGSTWSNVGTNSMSYARHVVAYAPSFALRVVVTSGGSTATSPEFYVYNEQ